MTGVKIKREKLQINWHRIADIRVIHHPLNLNLGRALQTGFRNSKGDIIVVLDIDLSYSFEHIEQ